MTDPIPIESPLDSPQAEFSIRFAGIRYQFHCHQIFTRQLNIRLARALSVRGTVVAAQPSQYWRLDRRGTFWTYCAATAVSPVFVADVQWVLANNRKLIQSHANGKMENWAITRTVAPCYKCDTPCDVPSLYWHRYMGVGPQPGCFRRGKWVFWTPVCPACVARFDFLWRDQFTKDNLEDDPWEFLSRTELDKLASQDRSGNIRWVRKFVAVGRFTTKQFRILCSEFDNVCLRCGKSRPLVADHVIPLARGGRNDITNIQPLCARCNGIKSDKSTDYRKRPRKVSAKP